MLTVLFSGDEVITPPPEPPPSGGPGPEAPTEAPATILAVRESDAFWREMYAGLAPFQYAEEDTGNALMKFLQAFSDPFELIHYLVRTDQSIGEIGWVPLLDPFRCPDELLPWLAQLVGASGAVGITNAESRTRIFDADAFKRGTVQSIYDEAARVGCTAFEVAERTGGAAYQVTLRFDNTQYSDARLRAIKTKIPAGIKVNVAFFNAVTYQDIVDTYGSYTDAEAANTDYTDLRGG
jgi:hypothetical protein